MKLEQQVTSLELSKHLRELGVKQESLFWWIYNDGMNQWEIHPFSEHWTRQDGHAKRTSAFTVAELGEMLPWLIEKDGNTFWLEIIKNGKQIEPPGKEHGIAYTEPRESDEETESLPYPQIEEDTESDARAKMLIYLLENNLIQNV